MEWGREVVMEVWFIGGGALAGGREEGYFTFLSGEWEEGIAWWEGYGGDGDVKDEEVG